MQREYNRGKRILSLDGGMNWRSIINYDKCCIAMVTLFVIVSSLIDMDDKMEDEEANEEPELDLKDIDFKLAHTPDELAKVSGI